MEKSRAIELLEHLTWDRDIDRNPYGDAINIAIDALRTCYDTETISMDNGDEYINYGDAVGGIEQLPSAQPEQHEGYWIPHEGIDGDIQYECSKCGVLWEFNDGTPEDNEAYFCPKCGTKMKGA